jgi:RsiW-degrading membrane proteinase PrsW (M82 family)
VSEPLRVVQWRNPAWWVLLVSMAAGAVSLVRCYRSGIAAYGTGLAVGAGLFAVYAVAWLALLARHIRYTRLPPKLLVVALLWGAVPATYWLALRANTAALSLYGKVFGRAWAHDWAPGLTAPFTEEPAKAAGLVLLIGLAPQLVRSPYDGLVIGAYTGLGLQISEDVLYAFNAGAAGFGADQAGAAWGVFLGRAVAGLVSHALFSAVLGSGIMWLLGRSGPRRPARGLLLVAAALAAHGGWDDMTAIGFAVAGRVGPVLVLFGLAAAELLVLWLALRLARAHPAAMRSMPVMISSAAAGETWAASRYTLSRSVPGTSSTCRNSGSNVGASCAATHRSADSPGSIGDSSRPGPRRSLK